MLERLRDEAHRFAITHHRKLRGKEALASALEEVEGIGPSRRKALLRHFGSLKNIRDASLEELSAAPGLPEGAARNLHAFLHPDGDT
jgi:excinuclease ABC subunit C